MRGEDSELGEPHRPFAVVGQEVAGSSDFLTPAAMIMIVR